MIVAGGPFDVACQAFLAKHEGLLWGDRPVESKGGGGKRSKYVCPAEDCGLAAWARPGVQIHCAEHDPAIPMAEQSPAPCNAHDKPNGPPGASPSSPTSRAGCRAEHRLWNQRAKVAASKGGGSTWVTQVDVLYCEFLRGRASWRIGTQAHRHIGRQANGQHIAATGTGSATQTTAAGDGPRRQ